MKFELKTGMKDSEIYDLFKEKISGEATQQIQQFYYPRDVEFKDKPKVLHEVIKSNENYALIEKKQSMLEQGSFYLTGINDEETYFIHEIPDDLKNQTLDEIIKEVNREDDGYERIQGDVLIKTINIKDFSKLERGFPEKIGFWHKHVDPNSLYPRSFEFDGDDFTRRSDYWGDTIFGSHEIVIDVGMLYRYWDFQNPVDEKYIVLGENVILNHNEHTQKTIKIPREHGLLIQAQKGNQKYDD